MKKQLFWSVFAHPSFRENLQLTSSNLYKQQRTYFVHEIRRGQFPNIILIRCCRCRNIIIIGRSVFHGHCRTVRHVCTDGVDQQKILISYIFANFSQNMENKINKKIYWFFFFVVVQIRVD